LPRAVPSGAVKRALPVTAASPIFMRRLRKDATGGA